MGICVRTRQDRVGAEHPQAGPRSTLSVSGRAGWCSPLTLPETFAPACLPLKHDPCHTPALCPSPHSPLYSEPFCVPRTHSRMLGLETK